MRNREQLAQLNKLLSLQIDLRDYENPDPIEEVRDLFGERYSALV